MPGPIAAALDDLVAPPFTERRARLGNGRDFWSTEPIGDIPSIALSVSTVVEAPALSSGPLRGSVTVHPPDRPHPGPAGARLFPR